jgi:divalent metal cation (Fe/Co/Zn/Cd) transporter
MRIALGIVGVFLVLAGCVWFLQGISVLPGTFMTGQSRWAVYGGIAVIVGAILLVTAARKRGSRPS